MSKSPQATAAHAVPLAPDGEPDRSFVTACRAGGVGDSVIPALWRLHAGPAGGHATCWSVEELIQDHAEWARYRSSRTGDAAAARAFQKRWTEYVRAFCEGRATREQADELASRFFERVYRLVDGNFRWQCPFSVYLRAVLVNLSRDSWARQARTRERERSIDALSSDQLARWTAGAPPQEERLLKRERAGAMSRALAALGALDRALLVAFLVDEKSGEDIGRALGLQRAAVYQRLRRAKARLRTLLESEDAGSASRARRGAGKARACDEGSMP